MIARMATVSRLSIQFGVLNVKANLYFGALNFGAIDIFSSGSPGSDERNRMSVKWENQDTVVSDEERTTFYYYSRWTSRLVDYSPKSCKNATGRMAIVRRLSIRAKFLWVKASLNFGDIGFLTMARGGAPASMNGIGCPAQVGKSR